MGSTKSPGLENPGGVSAHWELPATMTLRRHLGEVLCASCAWISYGGGLRRTKTAVTQSWRRHPGLSVAYHLRRVY